jgi:NAD-dependent dihydropyrimidine dehydrogenase PreA subunit
MDANSGTVIIQDCLEDRITCCGSETCCADCLGFCYEDGHVFKERYFSETELAGNGQLSQAEAELVMQAAAGVIGYKIICDNSEIKREPIYLDTSGCVDCGSSSREGYRIPILG